MGEPSLVTQALFGWTFTWVVFHLLPLTSSTTNVFVRALLHVCLASPFEMPSPEWIFFESTTSSLNTSCLK